ncbi:MAG: DinB family protein [Bacteroidota bacterium]
MDSDVTMESIVITEFKKNALYRMDESTRMIESALDKITEVWLWKRPNQNSNSIGNLILHLCGNITQYAIASLGEIEDTRQRSKEFSTEVGYTKQELLDLLKITVQRAKEVIANSNGQQLIKTREVQGFNFSGIGVVMHVVEHYSYHTGQIAFWVKQLVNEDLKFYEGMNLNIKNKN